MTTAYQYDASGYLAGTVEDYGLLPNNATYAAPHVQEGYMPCWNGDAWEQVENHSGREGYVNGQPYVMREFGPLPEGWSETPPPPTPQEQEALRKHDILARLQEIDAASVRALRAMTQGEHDPADADRLAELNAEAKTLRLELAVLSEAGAMLF